MKCDPAAVPPAPIRGIDALQDIRAHLIFRSVIRPRAETIIPAPPDLDNLCGGVDFALFDQFAIFAKL